MSKQDDIEAAAKASYVTQMNENNAWTTEQLYVLAFIRGAIYGVEDARKIAKGEPA